MCDHYEEWALDEKTGVLRNKRGDAIKNSDGFRQVKAEVEALSMVEIQAVYYQIPREHNMAADSLSRKAIEKAS